MHDPLLEFMGRAPAAYVPGRARLVVAHVRVVNDPRYVAVAAHARHERAEYPAWPLLGRRRLGWLLVAGRDVSASPVNELPPLFA